MRWSQQQLEAYNARRQRPVTPSADEPGVDFEADLHEQIFAECRQRRWIAFHGAMSERTHRTLGEPDFIILAENGRVLLIECKSRTGKITPEQQAVIHAAKAMGHTVHVVRSFAEFQNIV